MNKLIPSFFAALALSCASGASPTNEIFYDPCEPVVVVPDAAATAAQLEGIKAAIKLWKEVGVGSLSLESAPGQQHVRVYFKDALALFHGVYEPSNGEVRINNVMANRALDITIAHELGHAIGLPHVDRGARISVMNPSNETIAPTVDDAKQLRERWLCPAPAPF